MKHGDEQSTTASGPQLAQHVHTKGDALGACKTAKGKQHVVVVSMSLLVRAMTYINVFVPGHTHAAPSLREHRYITYLGGLALQNSNSPKQ